MSHDRTRRPTAVRQLLIGLGIVVLLVAISIPGVLKTRDEMRLQMIRQSLMTLYAAKIYYAERNGLKDGTEVTIEQLIEQGRVITEMPPFPADLPSDALRLNPIGEQPTVELDGRTIYPIPRLVEQAESGAETDAQAS